MSLGLRLKKCLLYVDRSVIVLNKPPGLVCQPSFKPSNQPDRVGFSDDFTKLLYDAKNKFKLNSLPYPVHRLDKPTTGALVLACTAASARDLSHQFQTRTVQKTYLALVRGGEKSFDMKKYGEIRAPLHINDDGRVSLSSNGSNPGQFAATDWELLASSPKAPVSLLRLRLHTGLKHQIRLHMAEFLRTPIIGDNLYSRSKLSEAITSIITEVPENRLFLHSFEVSFLRYRKTGPKKRFRLGIFAPLPEDFLKMCSDLEIHVDSNETKGGLSVDGVRVNERELSDIDGRWMT